MLIVAGFYGILALGALLNLLFMRRPKPGPPQPNDDVCVLIPARNEAHNLGRLVPQLLEPNPGLKLYVYDDDSEDATAEVAAAAGARVIRGGPLPQGWTGKNWACHQLAKVAAEDSDADWLLYLDADVEPAPDFIPAMRSLGPGVAVVTGFPTVVPGRGVEPIFLAWVGWVLLSSNPFWITERTGMGHNRFKNGQVHMWRREVYTALWPNEQVRGRIMEDVSIGRLLARAKKRVRTANLSAVLKVRMYETWRETLDGMSKNSYEVAGSVPGTLLIAALFLVTAWLWVLYPPALVLLTLNGLFVSLTCRAPLWPALLMPLVLTIGAFTMVRSTLWKLRGRTTWKGRVYP